jgi:hypothetical protein
MKKMFIAILALSFYNSHAQELNSTFNKSTEYGTNKKGSIEVTGNHLNIKTKVIYNATPDGYHITYTYTSISESVDVLEELTYKKIEQLGKDIKKIEMKKKDMMIDVISLDPIFSFKHDTSNTPKPTGYKSTHNVTFNIKDIGMVDNLSRICFKLNIYDIIDITPYINNVTFINDSLSEKSVKILNDKKALAHKIGFIIEDGKPSFQKKRNTLYPSERYLKSYIKNSSIYKHHISQNASTSYNRKVDVDSYYNLDLRDADFVFNANEVKPVIQFIYEINYGFLKRDRDEEARVKEEKEILEKRKKDIYILDEKGRMKKVSF